MDEIIEVTRPFLKKLFDSDNYEPRGMFVCEDEIDGKTVWTAVDNRNGEALPEEFLTKYAATMWLRGRRIRNRFGELLNKDGKRV
ncbi:MAG: hypothetical protein ACI4WZ_00900 [Eubacteriales bacterium]